jgi:dTDP-4-amino-4,6-dideoxygalactose transaminase
MIVPALDWTATRQAVRSLGAVPVPVAIDAATLTLSPTAATGARTDRIRAAVACHLHGVPADVPAMRDALPGLPLVEDCAASFDSALDGQPVGTLGDVAVFSLGPGKTIDAGEGGVLVFASTTLHRAAVTRPTHPLRQSVTGLDAATACSEGLLIRPHPLAAILALHELSRWDRDAAVKAHRDAAARLADSWTSASTVLGLDNLRVNAQPPRARPKPARRESGLLRRHHRRRQPHRSRDRFARRNRERPPGPCSLAGPPSPVTPRSGGRREFHPPALTDPGVKWCGPISSA